MASRPAASLISEKTTASTFVFVLPCPWGRAWPVEAALYAGIRGDKAAALPETGGVVRRAAVFLRVEERYAALYLLELLCMTNNI